MVATIDAVLIGIGLWLLDVPLAFALAVLVFMGSFVPYVGRSCPASSRCSSASPTEAGARARRARPRRGRSVHRGHVPAADHPEPQVDLHPAVILLAVAAGGSLFGIAGAYLAVPVTAARRAVYASLAAEERRE